MTKQELKIIYNNNIIDLQSMVIKKLTINPFIEEFSHCSFKDKLNRKPIVRKLNKENIKCLKAVLKVLKRNYKKDLKACENEPTEELMSTEKVEELVNEKVNQSDF